MSIPVFENDNKKVFFDKDCMAAKDTRPWAQRGFEEIKPVSVHANQSHQNERIIPVDPDGTPHGYPDMQSASPDSVIGRAGKGTG